MSNTAVKSNLPLDRDIKSTWILSFICAVLMGVLSLFGLLFPESIYKTEVLIQSYFTNDIVNLILGLPILLGSMWLTNRGKLVGLLFWPGALLYIIYNYIAVVFGRPFDIFTFAYLALILISAYSIYDLIRKIDSNSVKQQLAGAVAEKLAGWFLLIFGILFLLRAATILVGARLNQAVLPLTEIGVSIADIVISILWIIGGIMLIRIKPLGYIAGLGLLFAASMLFVGLIIILIIQPVLTTAPFSPIDIIVVALMGLILSIPFFLFLRGTIKASHIE
jgi:hypothetical protein